MREFFKLDARQLLVWGAVSLVGVAVALLDPATAARQSLFDELLQPKTPPDDVLLVKIDDASINQTGQWPWDRRTMAELVRRVDSARAIGIDVSLREPSREGAADDTELARALRETSPPIVLPSVVSDGALQQPYSAFRQHTRTGFSNIPVGSDGVVRDMFVRSDGMTSFSATLADAATAGTAALPGAGRTRIAFYGPNGTFDSVSAISLLRGSVSPERIRGAVVLVGVTAPDLQSFYQTPFGRISGIEIQANAFANIRSGTFVTPYSPLTTALTIIALSFVVVVASTAIRQPVLLLTTVAGIIGTYVVVAYAAAALRFEIDLLYVPLAVALTALASVALHYARAAREAAATRAAYRHVNALIESLTEGVAFFNTNEELILVNPVAQDALGLRDVADLTTDRLLRELEQHADVRRHMQACKHRRSVVDLGEVYVGERYWRIRLAPVRRPDHPLLGITLLMHDVTERKELERVREDFTSMMVHELRSPLDAIKDLSTSLARGGAGTDDPDMREQYLSLIQSNASQMLTLVGDLLDAAKIESGSFEIAPEATDIRALLTERETFFARSASEKGVELSTRIASDVPETVQLDPDRFVQILNNLISNAVKYTDEGGRVVIQALRHAHGANIHDEAGRHDISWFMPGDDTLEALPASVVIAVTDSGQGIQQEHLPNLFNKFEQFEKSASSDTRGTGLGLVIAKGLAEAHGGTIGVGSTYGEGSTFYVTIPLARE